MTQTTNLSIDLLDVGQRDKETTINEAFNTLDGNAGKILGVYTVAGTGSPPTGGLPAASSHTNALAIATDVGSPDTKWLVYSDGTNWRQIVQVNDTIAAS